MKDEFPNTEPQQFKQDKVIKYSFDSHCGDLAEGFLCDDSKRTPDDVKELAQAIQDAVENWFAGRK